MPEADFQRWVESGLSMLTNTKQQWPSIPPTRHHIAYYGIGTDARMLATGYLMLGRLDEARAAFRECAEGFMKGVDPVRDNVSAEIGGLEAAILTGDRGVWSQAAEATPEFPGKKKPLAYPYVMFLKSAMLKQEADAARWAGELGKVDPSALAKKGWYGSASGVCSAIVSRDPAAVRAGLEELLTEHKGKARAAWRGLPQGALCFTGAALLLLARDLGLNLEVDSPYIPSALYHG